MRSKGSVRAAVTAQKRAREEARLEALSQVPFIAHATCNKEEIDRLSQNSDTSVALPSIGASASAPLPLAVSVSNQIAVLSTDQTGALPPLRTGDSSPNQTGSFQIDLLAERSLATLPYLNPAKPFDDARPYDSTYALTLAYDGAPFSGFARQPGQLTVQGNLEEVLSLLFRRPVETTCSGRTDSGVHARGQVVSFDVDEEEIRGRSTTTLRRSLNALTHEGITIREVTKMYPGFSARFDAKSREYHYHLCRDEVTPLFMKNFAWFVPGNLDVSAMEEASRYLIGEHDFKSFCLTASAIDKPTCRNVQEISFYYETIMGESVLTIKVVGNAFLHSMVRTIVGTLVAVGRGQRKPDWVKEVLEAKNRSAAGENAPAQGLVFWQVFY